MLVGKVLVSLFGFLAIVAAVAVLVDDVLASVLAVAHDSVETSKLRYVVTGPLRTSCELLADGHVTYLVPSVA